MQISSKPSRLSNLYKPLVILLSTYAFVNLVGFFIQHDFDKNESSHSITTVVKTADESLIPIEKTWVTPAPPDVKIHSKKKVHYSEETINPHLP